MRPTLGKRLRNAFAAVAGEAVTYTDRMVGRGDAMAYGDTGRDAASFESVAGLFERSLMQARLTGVDAEIADAFSPAILAAAGRCLVQSGEWICLVEPAPNGWRVAPATAWEIVDGFDTDDRNRWTYRLECPAPKATIQRRRSSRYVAHVVVRADNGNPWTGRGLWEATSATAKMAAAGEAKLREELNSSTGQLVQAQRGLNKDQKTTLTSGLKKLKGGLAVTGVGFANSGNQAGDVKQIRLGANPPESLVQLREQSAILLGMAAGVPAGLTRGGQGSESREALRTFLFAGIGPLAGLIGHELRRVFNAPDLEVHLGRLNAADLSGRARSAKLLIEAGVDREEALRLCGFRE